MHVRFVFKRKFMGTVALAVTVICSFKGTAYNFIHINYPFNSIVKLSISFDC